MPMHRNQFWVNPYKLMLKIYNCLADIDFRQLMDVYEEWNRINGKSVYGKFPANLQMLYSEQDFYAYLVEFFREPSARYAVWIHDGRYVSALRLEAYNNGLLLNALETRLDTRNCGFAKMLIKSVLNDLRSKGSGVLYSHIQKNNAISIRAYLSCGFSVFSDSAVYLDGTIRPDSYSLSLNY